MCFYDIANAQAPLTREEGWRTFTPRPFLVVCCCGCTVCYHLKARCDLGSVKKSQSMSVLCFRHIYSTNMRQKHPPIITEKMFGRGLLRNMVTLLWTKFRSFCVLCFHPRAWYGILPGMLVHFLNEMRSVHPSWIRCMWCAGGASLCHKERRQRHLTAALSTILVFGFIRTWSILDTHDHLLLQNWSRTKV